MNIVHFYIAIPFFCKIKMNTVHRMVNLRGFPSHKPAVKRPRNHLYFFLIMPCSFCISVIRY